MSMRRSSRHQVGSQTMDKIQTWPSSGLATRLITKGSSSVRSCCGELNSARLDNMSLKCQYVGQVKTQPYIHDQGYEQTRKHISLPTPCHCHRQVQSEQALAISNRCMPSKDSLSQTSRLSGYGVEDHLEGPIARRLTAWQVSFEAAVEL